MLGKLKHIFYKKTDNLYSPLDIKHISLFNRNRPYGKQKLICYAPFRSLRFSQSGSIIVCCYNKEYSIGKYPETSIPGAWKSNRLQTLRKHIQNNDLSLGCGLCKKNIESGNYSSTDAVNFDYHLKKNYDYPDMMEFELGNLCNLECIMCSGDLSTSIRKNREGQEPYVNVYDYKFVEQLKEFIPHLSQVSFIGGEPFLIDLYFAIWEQISTLNPGTEISVTTNGLILNPRVKETLSKGKFNIRISLESLKKERYEMIRKNGNFEKLIENINYFKAYCEKNNTYFDFKVLPMRQNREEIPEIIEYGNINHIPIKFQTVYFPPDCAIWNMEPEQLDQLSEYYKSITIETKNDIQKLNKRRFEELITQIDYFYSAALKNKEKRNILKSKDNTELQKILFDNIADYITKTNTGSTDAVSKIKHIIQNLSVIFNKINDKQLKTALINLIELPTDMFVAEIEISSPEKLKERLLQASK